MNICVLRKEWRKNQINLNQGLTGLNRFPVLSTCINIYYIMHYDGTVVPDLVCFIG